MFIFAINSQKSILQPIMNKLFLVLLLVVIVVVAWAMKGQNIKSDQFATVGVDEFEKLLTDTAQVVCLDVRTPSEFREGHLRGAILIDVKTDSFMLAARDQLPKDKTIAVYCRSGRRSATAASMLSDEGYKMVNLDGGINAWKDAGKLIIKEK